MSVAVQRARWFMISYRGFTFLRGEAIGWSGEEEDEWPTAAAREQRCTREATR